MGQAEIIKLLREKKKWLDNQEIADELETTLGNTNICLRKLLKEGAIIRQHREKGRFQKFVYQIDPTY